MPTGLSSPEENKSESGQTDQDARDPEGPQQGVEGADILTGPKVVVAHVSIQSLLEGLGNRNVHVADGHRRRLTRGPGGQTGHDTVAGGDAHVEVTTVLLGNLGSHCLFLCLSDWLTRRTILLPAHVHKRVMQMSRPVL